MRDSSSNNHVIKMFLLKDWPPCNFFYEISGEYDVLDKIMAIFNEARDFKHIIF